MSKALNQEQVFFPGAVVGFRAHPAHEPDLILTNSTCKDLISRCGHILRFWEDVNYGGHDWACYPGTGEHRAEERGLSLGCSNIKYRERKTPKGRENEQRPRQQEDKGTMSRTPRKEGVLRGWDCQVH